MSAVETESLKGNAQTYAYIMKRRVEDTRGFLGMDPVQSLTVVGNVIHVVTRFGDRFKMTVELE